VNLIMHIMNSGQMRLDRGKYCSSIAAYERVSVLTALESLRRHLLHAAKKFLGQQFIARDVDASLVNVISIFKTA